MERITVKGYENIWEVIRQNSLVNLKLGKCNCFRQFLYLKGDTYIDHFIKFCQS